VLERFAPP